MCAEPTVVSRDRLRCVAAASRFGAAARGGGPERCQLSGAIEWVRGRRCSLQFFLSQHGADRKVTKTAPKTHSTVALALFAMASASVDRAVHASWVQHRKSKINAKRMRTIIRCIVRGSSSVFFESFLFVVLLFFNCVL